MRLDSTWTERVEQSQHQHNQHKKGQQVLEMVKTPQDDQHTVYTTAAGPVVGSGSATPPTKQLPIRTPDNSPNKLKPKKSREDCSAADLDNYYNDLSDVKWEFANLVGDD